MTTRTRVTIAAVASFAVASLLAIGALVEGRLPGFGAGAAALPKTGTVADDATNASHEITPKLHGSDSVEASGEPKDTPVTLASLTDPRLRAAMTPAQRERLTIAAPSGTEPASDYVAPKAAKVPAFASTDPAKAPEFEFCPVGTKLHKDTEEGERSKFCARADAAGIEVKDGPYVAWWGNGKKRAEGAYREGKRHGAWNEWYQSGTVASQGNYRDGRRDGAWTFYRESGVRAETGTYKGDEKDGRWTVFDDAGHRTAEGTLRPNGKLAQEEGVWTYFWPDGSKKEQGEFDHGRREGKWTAWNIAGGVTAVNIYNGGDQDFRP